LPSVGHIDHLRWPSHSPELRLDSGVDAGDEVSPFYDPLLGKVIAWGESRSEACDRLREALIGLEIVGVTTNRALLTSVLGDVEFQRATVATDFLDLRRGHLAFGESAATAEDHVLAAIWHATRATDPAAAWSDTSGWRLSQAAGATWRFGENAVSVAHNGAGQYTARIAEQSFAVRLIERGAGSLQVELSGRARRLTVLEIGPELHLFRREGHVLLRLARTEDALQASAHVDEGSLVTPLPGTIVAVHVSAGQSVKRGAPLVTVEAMKMEHTLTAPTDGVVTRIPFTLSDRVAAGAILVELTPVGP
jgi:3-methylcrotonyl-CoA carboxylase alpha subunit